MYFLFCFYCQLLRKFGSPYPIYAVILMIMTIEMATLVSAIIIINITTGHLISRETYFGLLLIFGIYTGYFIHKRKWVILRKYSIKEIYWEEIVLALAFYTGLTLGQILLAIEIGIFIRDSYL